MSYGSVDGLENKSQEAHIEDSLKIQKLKSKENTNSSGICEECGEKISEARLKAIPNANCCVKCQQDQEKNPIKIICKNPYIP